MMEIESSSEEILSAEQKLWRLYAIKDIANLRQGLEDLSQDLQRWPHENRPKIATELMTDTFADLMNRLLKKCKKEVVVDILLLLINMAKANQKTHHYILFNFLKRDSLLTRIIRRSESSLEADCFLMIVREIVKTQVETPPCGILLSMQDLVLSLMRLDYKYKVREHCDSILKNGLNYMKCIFHYQCPEYEISRSFFDFINQQQVAVAEVEMRKRILRVIGNITSYKENKYSHWIDAIVRYLVTCLSFEKLEIYITFVIANLCYRSPSTTDTVLNSHNSTFTRFIERSLTQSSSSSSSSFAKILETLLALKNLGLTERSFNLRKRLRYLVDPLQNHDNHLVQQEAITYMQQFPLQVDQESE